MDAELKGYIFEIQKLSTEDGPGIRTTVFFKECPLRCVWCHNPESVQRKMSIQWYERKCIGCQICVKVCPHGALHMNSHGLHIDRDKCEGCGVCADECPSTALKKFGEWYTVDALFKEINKDKVYYEKSGGGVTFSGGEPTLQMEFLIAIAKKCKKMGIHTAVETCGLGTKKNYEKLIPWIDLLLLDIKEIDSGKHKQFVGHPNENILENAIWFADLFSQEGKEIWIRTPLIPRYTATDENVKGIGEFIVKNLHNNIARWDLLAFNNLAKSKYERMDHEWDLAEDPLLSKEMMEHFHNVAISTGVNNVQWSGMTQNGT